jgi:hypothetical protein
MLGHHPFPVLADEDTRLHRMVGAAGLEATIVAYPF